MLFYISMKRYLNPNTQDLHSPISKINSFITFIERNLVNIYST